MGLKKWNVWFKFLVSYLLLLIIPTLVTVFIYKSMMAQTEKNVYEEHLASFRQVSQIITGHFYNTENLAHQISSNLFVTQYINLLSPFEEKKTLPDFNKIPPTIASYLITNDYIEQVQIYAQKSDTLVTKESCYLRLDSFYGTSFSIEGMSRQKWQEDFLTSVYKGEFMKNIPVVFTRTSGKHIVYAQTLVNSGKSNIANIFIFINQDKLLGMFDSLSGTETGFSYIVDGDYRWMSKSDISRETINAVSLGTTQKQGYFRQEINGEEMLITYVKTEEDNLTYVSAVSYDYIGGKFQKTVFFLGLVLFGSFALGIIIAVALSYYQAKPINRIFELLSVSKGNDSGSYSFDFINDRLSLLINSNASLREEVARQLPATRISLIYRLLNGDCRQTADLKQDFERLGIQTGGKFYAVLIASINDTSKDASIEEFTAYKVMLKEELGLHMASIIGIYDMNFEKQAIILSSRYESYVDLADALNRNVESIKARLQSEVNINFSFSGSITDDFSKIYLAFYEAQTALDYERPMNNMTVQWYKKGNEKSDSFFLYSLSTELHLIDAVKFGKINECKAAFSRILKSNKDIISNGHITANLLLNAIVSSILRAFRDKQEDGGAQLQERLSSLESCILSGLATAEKFGRLRRTVLDICGEQKDNCRIRSNLLIDKVLEYINGHYTESSLSLISVATEFNITEAYLSVFFKENTGENFSKYIERLRMEKSSDLMAKEKLSISETAHRVGYNSSQVFRRVYKRYYGKSPSETKNEFLK